MIYKLSRQLLSYLLISIVFNIWTELTQDFFAANKRVIYTIPSQQQLILWILGCISPFWWHKCVQSSPITDTIYIVHTSSTRSRPLVFYKYFTYKVVTITKVMLLGFYILINVVSQNALKTSMCLCSHYSSKWQKKCSKRWFCQDERFFTHK